MKFDQQTYVVDMIWSPNWVRVNWQGTNTSNPVYYDAPDLDIIGLIDYFDNIVNGCFDGILRIEHRRKNFNKQKKTNLEDRKGKHCSLVFCFQMFSDLLWEKIVLVIEKKLFSWSRKTFLSFSCGFLRYDTLEIKTFGLGSRVGDVLSEKQQHSDLW